jgi:RND family efflux transporter MFP subunit
MKKIVMLLALIAVSLFSCTKEAAPHKHGEKDKLEALAYTLYSDKTELFVEFKPLIVGNISTFAAHFTKLGKSFEAFTEGTVTLTLTVGETSATYQATEPSNPGIFRLALKPTTAGPGALVFDIQTKGFSDKITIDGINVYADQKSALASQEPETGGGNEITYLKEQAWKVEFANAAVTRQMFTNVIRTSGQILAAPGDEVMVTAKASGTVHFAVKNATIGSEISSGSRLFTISSGDLIVGNLDANYQETKAKLDKMKVDFDRATELVKDQLISAKEFQDTKLQYEMAKIAFSTVSRNYSGTAQTISSPMSGFLKNIMVTEGQLVEPGTPLATISKNKNLILQANLSQKYFHLLNVIRSANIKTPFVSNDNTSDSITARVISFGKSTSSNVPFVPITFEIDNRGSIIPGSVVEVFLKTDPIPNALVIPVSALIEEQGTFFVFVQTGGESFEKREIKLGANDGQNTQVISGVMEGERVVTKGAYQIKLSMASGTLPAHGHEH